LQHLCAQRRAATRLSRPRGQRWRGWWSPRPLPGDGRHPDPLIGNATAIAAKSIATPDVAEDWWSERDRSLIRSRRVGGVGIHQIGRGVRRFADGQPQERLTHGYWAEAAAGLLEAVVVGAATERAAVHASTVRFAANPVRFAHCAADGRREDERHRYDEREGGHPPTHRVTIRLESLCRTSCTVRCHRVASLAVRLGDRAASDQ